MSRVLKYLLVAISAAAATAAGLVVAVPVALYSYGLEIASERPEPSGQRVSASRVAEVWQAVERSEEIVVRRMDPWTPIWRLFLAPGVPQLRPGERACSHLARVYVYERPGRLRPAMRWTMCTPSSTWNGLLTSERGMSSKR